MALPPQIIKKINFDIILASVMIQKNVFSGAELDFIYRVRHGIQSHGFDLLGMYKVHIKDDTYVLIEELKEQRAA